MSKLIRAALEELQQGEPYVLGEEAALDGDQIELIEQITDLSYGNQEFELVTEAYNDLMRFDKVLERTGGQLTLEQGKFVSLMMHHVLAPIDVHTGRRQEMAMEEMSTMTDAERYVYATEGLGDWLGRVWKAIVDFVANCIEWIKSLFGFGKKAKASAEQKQAQAEEEDKLVNEAVKAKPEDRQKLLRQVHKKLGTTNKVTTEDGTPIRSKITFSPELKKQIDEIKKKGAVKPVPDPKPVVRSPNANERVFVRSTNLSFIVPLSGSGRAQIDHKEVLEGLDRWVKFIEKLQAFNNGVVDDIGKLVDVTWKSLERVRVGVHDEVHREMRRDWDEAATGVVASIAKRSRVMDPEAGIFNRAQVAVSASHTWAFGLTAKAGKTQDDGNRTFFDLDMGGTFETKSFEVTMRSNHGELMNKGSQFAKEVESRAKDLLNKIDVLTVSNAQIERVLARCTDTTKKNLLDSITNPSAQAVARSFTLPAVSKCVKGLSQAILAVNVKVHAEALRAHTAALGHAKNLRIAQVDSLIS